MKIGVFADAHNNAVALDAVLRTLEDEGCEVLACAGDIIGIGPWPEETVQRLMRIPNLIAVLLLSPVIVKETKKYVNDLDAVDDTPVPVVKTGIRGE